MSETVQIKTDFKWCSSKSCQTSITLLLHRFKHETCTYPTVLLFALEDFFDNLAGGETQRSLFDIIN